MAKKKPAIKPLTGRMSDFSGIVLKAAARGHTAAVKQYLKVNPEWLNQEGPHFRTLLWEAAYKGRTETVAELIKLGADVHPMASYYTPMLVDLSALAVARLAGNDELVELLEQHGACDDLYAACHRGDLEAIDRFLSDDPDAVTRPSKDEPPHPRAGWLPIHYAVAGQQLGALRLLIGHGATIGESLTLLVDWADGNRELIRYLRDQADRETPKSKRKSNKSQKPKSNVPAIDRPDWMGFPLLVDACRGNHNAPDDPARVQALLRRGANVNITDHKAKTPLHRASQAGFVKITALLFDHGAELEIADNKGCTPIFDAAHYGRVETLKMLIERGANIHHTESRGETPLFAAARGAKVDAFETLLEAGCDPFHKNNRGKRIDEVVRAARHQTDDRRRILKIYAKLKR